MDTDGAGGLMGINEGLMSTAWAKWELTGANWGLNEDVVGLNENSRGNFL